MAQTDIKGKTCLVTGASGFIGSILCNELKRQGATVRAMLHADVQGDWESSYICKLGEEEIPNHVMQGVEIIFHLAGRAHSLSDNINQEQLYFKTNVQGTLDLLKAAKTANVNKFIFFSSVKAMGEECDARLSESSNSMPLTMYGRSKLEAEEIVLAGGFITAPTVLRLSMVYGDSDKGNLPKMIKAISMNRFPPLPKIHNKRSMIHVKDVVRAAILAASSQTSSGEAYILCDGIDYSTRKLYEKICELMNKKVPAWTIPVSCLYFIAKIGDVLRLITNRRVFIDSDNLQKLIGNSYYSSNKIQSELGFSPKYTLYGELPNIISNLK